MEHSSHVPMRPTEEVETDFATTHIESAQEKEPQGKSGRHVLRPGDAAMRRIRASVAAALVGFGGAMMTDSAKAQGIPGLEQTGKVWAAGAINGVINQIIPGIPGALVVDSRGNPLIVQKTPAQMASTRPAEREPGVNEIAAKMNLSITERNGMFRISSNSDPSKYKNIIKYTDEDHYTNIIRLLKAPNGGLELFHSYRKGKQNFPETFIINMDSVGNLTETEIK